MLTLKQNLPIIVPNELIEFISEHVQRDGISIISFNDTKYHPSTGGFRPVEIMVEKLGNYVALHYYTEFAYEGQGSYAQLCKSNDFDLSLNTYYSEFMGLIPLNDEVGETFEMFVKNTLSYASLGMYDEIKVSFIGGHLLLHKDMVEA
ncbi:TPA: DUF2787 family protein [Vibrio parahaemolyticus]|nr:DUF2787 family protein [Vibrio parahaemolyticus]